jgi:pimeloyl-ACP methyl ester carboxylesterase
MGVLDGIRAVNNFKDTLGLKNPMVVGVGYSGGALATGWAASLHPSYAPELNVKGWVQGGTPSNLTGTLVFIDDTAFAGFLPTAVVGLSKPSAYGAELNPILNSILTDTGREKLDFAATHCAVENLFSFGEMSLFSTNIQSLGRGLLTEPTIQSVMNKNTMAVNKAETPTVPVFVYHATQDEVIPYANASTMVNSWCGWDANVKFTTYANGGHATTELIALPDALKFVENAFAGKTASGCTKNTELASVLNPIALGVSLEPLLLKLIEALAHLGKQDANVKSDTKVLAQTIT